MQQPASSTHSSIHLDGGSSAARVVQFKRDTVTVQMDFQSVLSLNHDRGVFSDGTPVRLDLLVPQQSGRVEAHTVFAQVKTVTRRSFDCFHVQFVSEALQKLPLTQLTAIEAAVVIRCSTEANVASS